jgi:hypothetical protein
MKMAKRKTVDVEYMKTFANTILASADPKQVDVRRGVAVMIEEVLFNSGNYKGFRYLDWNETTKAPDDSSRVQYF